MCFSMKEATETEVRLQWEGQMQSESVKQGREEEKRERSVEKSSQAVSGLWEAAAG